MHHGATFWSTQQQISRYAGVDASNSFKMVTNFVPGSYMVHDQLHVRGGHQVTWAIDGVPIPNTNIASNVGPQFNPKDVSYMQAETGSYAAEYGDRIYGVFNVAPNSGFERNRQAEFIASYGNYHQYRRLVELRRPYREVRLLRQRQREQHSVRIGAADYGQPA